jgi:hypothetical protein
MPLRAQLQLFDAKSKTSERFQDLFDVEKPVSSNKPLPPKATRNVEKVSRPF